MAKNKSSDLKNLFKQAAEIAQQVPESMQEAAFNRAIDLLTMESQITETNKTNTNKKNDDKKITQHEKADTGTSSRDDLLSLIDTTQHPEVKNASKVLDRSLMILRIALKDHSIDGLTPSLIAKILTDKFRISTTNYAVSMALGKATNLVNRIPDKQGFMYKIMAPGEKYLSETKSMAGSTDSASKKPKTISIKKNNQENSKNGFKQKSKSSLKVGSKKIMTDLIGEGFFDLPKKIKEIQEYISRKLGYTFNVTHLSPNLTRLLREGKLDRDKSSDGQYEYKRK